MEKKIVLFSVIIICAILTFVLIKQPIITISKNNSFKITGVVEITYKIYSNGDIYIDSHRNKDIEYNEINEHKFMKKISRKELNDIKEKLNDLNTSQYIVNNVLDSKWKYRIGNSNYYVKDIDLYQFVLEQYLDENYTQTINKRNLEKSIYDFIKENYTNNQPALYSGPFSMFSLKDDEKQIILNEYKKVHPNIEFSDDELLSIIGHQSYKIWHESTNSLFESD